MRDLNNAIAEYQRRFLKSNGRRGAFKASDYYQIRDMARAQDGSLEFFTAIDKAFMAAFMIGYRCAKREKRGTLNRK